MFFKNKLEILRMLYSEGGIEICTASGMRDDQEENILLRTLIQPDADVITYVSEAAFEHADIRDEHQKKITDIIRSIRTLRISLKGTQNLVRGTGLSVLSWGGYDSFISGGMVTAFIVGLLISLSSLFLKPIAEFLFQFYLKQVQEKISGKNS
ncbi:hypothetical protein QUF80_11120 [Desulfococcaceae bacterium HSG8]|nr:hypothetical protein [Desulfococcaceae bacterium HSG8]